MTTLTRQKHIRVVQGAWGSLGQFTLRFGRPLLGVTLVMLSLIPRSTFAGADPSEALGAPNLIISEFRVRGPNGANDEFVEIYNKEATAHTVSSVDASSGYALV